MRNCCDYCFRGSLRPHYGLFVMLIWIWSVLLLSHNIPWPALPLSNETNGKNETRDSNWKPPIFALDNIHLWPIQVKFWKSGLKYSGLNTKHLNSEYIQILKILMLGFVWCRGCRPMPSQKGVRTHSIKRPFNQAKDKHLINSEALEGCHLITA